MPVYIVLLHISEVALVRLSYDNNIVSTGCDKI